MNVKPSVLLLAVALSAIGCDPSEQQKAKWAEEKRIECLDKVCPGDTPPRLEKPLEEQVMKLNGEYFIAPRRYVSGFTGLIFYWPSKTPLTGRPDRQPYPERGKPLVDVAIETYLRHHDGKTYGPVRHERLRQAERDGYVISKEAPRIGLEVWRIKQPDRPFPAVWYVATSYVESDPNGAVLWCEDIDSSYDFCSTAFGWRPGIGAEMRLSAKHAKDWPEIYQETQRVLNLLKNA